MFQPPIMVIFREVFFEGYITYNIKTIYKYKILRVTPNCGIGSMYFPLYVLMGMCNFCLLGNFIFENCFDNLCNVSFKQHLPEDGHNWRLKHTQGYTAYNTINLHICICICWSHFSLWHFATFHTQKCEPIWETSHCKRLIIWRANIIWATLNNTSLFVFIPSHF